MAAVDRRFEAIMFDWDGTAVPDRRSDARDLRILIESLCANGMDLCVVTGTHVQNVDDQLRARPRGPGRLLLAVNRGSEVYEIDGDGPLLLHRRQATDAENDALDRAAAVTIERLSTRGLAAEVVSERLNRRKIDLIPLSEWSDPPKAQIDRLLATVEARLAAAKLGGLPEVVEIARQAARDAGLDDPRVTSDAKHVEIGLTDKSDAARELVARLWRDDAIGPSLLLIAGDELGPLGGLPGSDSLMLIPETREAVSVSVGVEPTGVPPGVTLLGGGPLRFCALLADQLERRLNGDAPDVHLDPAWSLTYTGIDHERERAVETLLTMADGVIGTSGAPLLSHPSAAPGAVVGGVYRGEGPTADLLDVPRWERLGPATAADDQVWRAFDLHSGVLAERVADGTTLRSVRFSSLARPGTAVLRVTSVPAIDSGPALVASDAHAPVIHRPVGEPEWAVAQGTRRAVAVAATQAAHRDGHIDRVAVYAPVDVETKAPDVARMRLLEAGDAGFERLFGEQRRAWAKRWAEADVRIEGDEHLQLATRIALFHLMASVPDHDEAAVGARGLSGHAYRGHVFWDTDVFVLPFLAATHPTAARAIIEYRVRRLSQALQAARAEGHRGARFPWESAALGVDATPRSGRDHAGHLVPIRTAQLELHIVADVAWASCCYVDWSGDSAFSSGAGHRLLIETARYWASCARVESDGSAHLYGVIGPDEYHEPVDDNMFTNVMARWNLRRAAASVCLHGGIDEDERGRWLELADAFVDGYDRSTGIYEQFAGFHALEPVTIAEIARERPVAADMLLGRDRVRNAQVIKQADVLMAHHLVPDECVSGSLEPNLTYYEPRTSHGSSLSPGVHAALLARAARFDEALHWLRVAADVDLADVTNTTAGGLHLATMGSVWQALASGFGGVRPLADSLVVDPRLPGEWQALELRVRFHGVPVRIRIGSDETMVWSEQRVCVRLGADGPARECGPDGITFRNP